MLRFLNLGTVVVLFLLIFASSCKKDALVKTGVQPEEDNVFVTYIDTFTISAKTILRDSVRVDGIANAALGLIQDSEFGKSVASFITQVRPGNTSVNINSSAVALFAKFSIQPELMYTDVSTNSDGDIPTSFGFDLYKLSDTISATTDYYSFNTIEHDATPIASCFYEKLEFDTITTLYKPITFELDSATAVDLLSYVNSDDQSFWNVYKGFTITTNESDFENNIMFLANPFHSSSKLSVAYKESASSNDTLYYDFIIDNLCERINNFNNDYNAGALGSSIGDSIQGKERLYVADMNGVGVDISVPFLSDIYNNDTIIVNKAELIIPVIDDANVKHPYHNHNELWLAANYNETINVSGNYNQSNLTHFLGAYSNGSFTFNITPDIQYILSNYTENNNQNFGYTLLSLYPEENTRASILAGTNPSVSSEKIKLKLTYSLVE